MPTSPDSVGPLRNKDAVRICNLANITVAEQKLTTLRQLKEGLDIAIADLDKQKRAEQIANKGLLVARFAKATCDSFVGLAAEMAEVALPEPAAKGAKAVAQGSKLASGVAETVSTAASGGKVSADQVIGIAKAASAYAPGGDATKLVIKSTTIKVEVINEAMNQRPEGVLKKAASYLYDLHAKLGDLVGLKKTAAFAKIAKQAFEYNESLGKAFNAAIDADDETLRRNQSLKTSLIIQARRLSKQIEQMEAFVQTCTPEPEMRLP